MLKKKYTWRKVSVVLEKSFCKPRVPPHAVNLDAPKKKSRGRGRKGEEVGVARKGKLPKGQGLKEFLEGSRLWLLLLCKKGGGSFFREMEGRKTKRPTTERPMAVVAKKEGRKGET